MRKFNSVVVAGALLAFGGSAFAQDSSLGTSRPGATQMKKKVEKKVRKETEHKEEKAEDGSQKKEEKMEHSEHSESENSPSTGNSESPN
jgi:hypothetical protein